MKKEIMDAVKVVLYEQYRNSLPETVKAIEEVINKGKKPSEIRDMLIKNTAKSEKILSKTQHLEITNHLTLVAEYIYERTNN